MLFLEATTNSVVLFHYPLQLTVWSYLFMGVITRHQTQVSCLRLTLESSYKSQTFHVVCPDTSQRRLSVIFEATSAKKIGAALYYLDPLGEATVSTDPNIICPLFSNSALAPVPVFLSALFIELLRKIRHEHVLKYSEYNTLSCQ